MLDQDIFVPPINEIRASHDRIMQCILAKCTLNGDNDPVDLTLLDKATSSIQNGIIQSLDYIAIYQLEYIENLYFVDKLESEAIEAICPGTHAFIPEILRFQENVQNLKLDGTQVNETDLEPYIQKIAPIREQIKKIAISKNAIIEQSQRIRKSKNSVPRSAIIVAIVAAIIGAVVGGAAVEVFRGIIP